MAVEEVKPEDKLEAEPDDLTPPEEELDEPLIEPEGKPDVRPHPLTPGGRRFEQVYAESKQNKRDLDAERALRVAAEAKLAALESKGQLVTEQEPEYTWPQLEAFITEGRITRADAEAHREAVLTKKLAKTIKSDFTKEVSVANRGQVLSNSIQKYIEAVPEIMTEGSDERERLETEFQFLASVQGLDTTKLDDLQRKVLQLTAMRTVYGSIDSLEKRNERPKGETHQEFPGGKRPQARGNSDQALLDGLSKRQVQHYNKMFLTGRYPNKWKDVVEELKFDPKAPKKVRQ